MEKSILVYILRGDYDSRSFTEYYRQLLASKTIERDYWKEYMENPIPNYECPYPYGNETKMDIFGDIKYILDELK